MFGPIPKKGPAETTAVQPEGVPERMSGRAVSTRSGGISGRAAGAQVTGSCHGSLIQGPPSSSRPGVLTASPCCLFIAEGSS